MRQIVTLVVLAHLAVNVLHGRAHAQLAVGLSAWQNVYVIGVILVAPLLAMVLIWTKQMRFGLVLLILSMSGALVFGVFFHYINISPDHVSHLPPGDARGLFRTTALLLGVLELLGVVIGVLALRSPVVRRQRT